MRLTPVASKMSSTSALRQEPLAYTAGRRRNSPVLTDSGPYRPRVRAVSPATRTPLWGSASRAVVPIEGFAAQVPTWFVILIITRSPDSAHAAISRAERQCRFVVVTSDPTVAAIPNASEIATGAEEGATPSFHQSLVVADRSAKTRWKFRRKGPTT